MGTAASVLGASSAIPGAALTYAVDPLSPILSYRPSFYSHIVRRLQKDLVRRLRNLVEVLRADSVEVESPEWPGLAAVSHCLVRKFVNNADKEVRLYSCLACVEIFALVRVQKKHGGEERGMM